MTPSTGDAATTDLASPSPRKTQVKRIATLVVATLILLTIAYGIGRAQGAQAVARAESTAHETQARMARSAQDTRGQLERRVTSLEGDLGRSQRASALLESRRQLGLALLSMDDRNFGIAQGQIEAARGALRSATPFDDAQMEAVQQRLAGVTILAAGDFADQRASILQLVHDFDAHVPAGAPSR